MSEDLETTNKLTEFGRLEDPKPNTVGQCLANFFWKRNVNVDEINSEKSDTVGDSLPTWAADVVSDSSFSTQSSSNVYDVDVNEGRSLPNVLKRISNLLALKSSNLKDYGDTNLKQYWMQDSVSKECYECSEKFTFVRRKHHCRVCGQIFCSQCCNQQIPGKIFGCTGKLKACTYCCKVVLSYLESSDFNAVLTNDLKLLQESLQSKFGMISPKSLEDNTLQTSIVHDDDHTAKRKISVGYQEENFFSENTNTTYLTTEEKCRALQNSTSLRNLFEEMCKPVTGLQFESHRYRLKTYTDCFLGSELVDWLIFQQKSKNRIQASAICQALLEGGYIESVSDPTAFIDGYAYYYKKLISYPELSTPGTNFDVPYTDEPHWVQQIPHESSTTDSDNEQASPMDIRQGNLTSSSSYLLDLNLEANTVYLSRPPDEYKTQNAVTVSDHQEKNEMLVVRPTEQIEIAPESGWFNANNNLREENEEKLAYTILSETFEQHEHNLLKQLLLSKGLSYSWWEIIIPLLHEIIGIIRPDKNHDATDLDIRHYVQFKILSGGLRSDTTLIGGIVCSKNVAHKDMLTDIENPKILLLECSIVYQRTEGRLMSLEPVLMQEYEYLKNVVTRISALKPNVVLVQKNISRIAQDMLLDYNITLVHNVKQSVLERLSRCTKADIVSSVDAHIGVPKLGTCKRFYVNSYKIQGDQKKTLMFFEGLPNPHLGSTVLLRGGSETELSKLKDVSVFMLFALYSWRLEKSYLMDEFAMPPNPNEFLDDNTPDTPEKKTEEQKRIERPVMKRFSRDEQPGENRKILVDDFTDPLQSKQEFFDVKSTGETLAVAELPFSNNFKKQLDDTILCVSPYVVFSVPYLETETGKKCKLRRYFPDDLYFSVHFENNVKNKWKNNSEENRSDQIEIKEKIKPLHPFLLMKLTESGEDVNVQNLLAHFRACGGRYEKKDNICIEIQTRTRPKSSENNLKDVLDPANHQKLAVLFCSYSTESNNAPAFCVNPWIVYMDFYGRNDIPLGCFLERYCFRSTYNCPSKSCDTPMVHHVRRFVHNVGCVTICLNHFDNEFYDDHIVMWTWCTKCQKVSPVVPMSVDTWSYSFAKYLELKFYGDVFSRRGQSSCNHSLHHDHYQYFGYKNYVATFKYSQITILEVSLPPPLIEIKYDNNKLHDESIDGIKNIAQKGHDLFSLIQDKLKNVTGEESESNLKQILLKEQNLFKQKIEEVQLKLTSPSIECKQFDEKVLIGAYWNISDSLTKLKRNVVEIVDIWNVRFNELARKKDVDKKKEKSNVEDILDYQESNVRDEKESINRKIGSFDNSDNDSYSSSSPKSHHRSQSESAVFSQIDDSTDGKKESDKKSVKTILSSLLPSSNNACVIPAPFSANEHYNLSDSSIPLIVFENQPSSIVSYTLASNEYRKLFDELSAKKTSTTSSDVSNSPVTMKRKSYGEKDKTDDDKTKNILGFLKTKEAKIDNANQINSTNVPEISFEASQIVSGPQEAAKKVRKAHVEVQFQEGSSNFFCRVYLAEQFAKLRAAVLPMGEEAYIRSLSRSVQWDARGGKSGSNFSKTVDDRFILKEMSKSEVDLFLESSSNYFAYMNKCHTTKQLTLLGKILGIYQIVFKNNSSVPYRSNILVMENLFYNRKVSQKFDLKGSMRNRLVVPDNQGEEIVLLDENLMKMTCDSPLYVLQHSKSVLINAIQNDTEFLSTQSVMDYSLLVGLDPDNKELILGIIDYIRTFTWDKRLETMVKKSGILGGQGKLPTIISPEEYQKRFIEAMHRYFLEVPDHWAGLSKTFEP